MDVLFKECIFIADKYCSKLIISRFQWVISLISQMLYFFRNMAKKLYVKKFM